MTTLDTIIDRVQAYYAKHPEVELSYDCPRCSEFRKTKPDLVCIRCNDTGVANRIQDDVMTQMWCECEEEGKEDYYENGEHKGCIVKHHYHCRKCGGVSQIG